MEDTGEQIGNTLRSARETAGLTVDDVVFRTRLPKSVVIALEAEDFSVFASPVYAKSFLAQYSDYLNVDAQSWLDALEPGAFAAGGSLNPLLDAPQSSASPEPVRADTRGGLLALVGLFLLSVGLVYGVMASYDYFESRFAREPAAEAVQAPEPRRSVVLAPAPKGAPPRPFAEVGEEVPDEPPPRAIIVR